MKFTVIWKPSAEQELAQLWEDADDRRDITMRCRRVRTRLAKSVRTTAGSRLWILWP